MTTTTCSGDGSSSRTSSGLRATSPWRTAASAASCSAGPPQRATIGEGDGGVRVETPFLVVRIMRDGRMDLFATGRYLDLVVDLAATPRFRERVVVCDSSRVDTLLAIPL